jgi:hypothetical protein
MIPDAERSHKRAETSEVYSAVVELIRRGYNRRTSGRERGMSCAIGEQIGPYQIIAQPERFKQ